MVEKPVLNNKGRVTGQREIRPVWNNAQRVNHQNKLTHPHPKRNFVPTAVATKSGQVPVNAAKQSSPRAAASITKTNNFNEKVNTARVNNVTTAGPKAVVSAAEGNGENVVKSSTCWIWRPTGNVIDHISKDSGSYMLKRFDYVDLQGKLNGCSRHMNGNKSFLIDYQEIDGGFVAFGGSSKGGKINGKDKHLFFSLRTECIVLSPDFKLLYVRSSSCLKFPDIDNMYSFDLKNVVPSREIRRCCSDDAGKKTTEEPTNKGQRNGQEKEGGDSNKEGDQNVQDLRAELDNFLIHTDCKEC
ncbi:hypothetical protein Tco_0832751 [Tanacetum coccineum]